MLNWDRVEHVVLGQKGAQSIGTKAQIVFARGFKFAFSDNNC